MRSIISLLSLAWLVAGAPGNALQIDLSVDPGVLDTPFASRVIALPGLLGVPILDEVVSVDLSFSPGTYVESTLYPGRGAGFVVITFDPLPSLSTVPGPSVDTYGFAEDGTPIPTGGFGSSYGPTAAPDTLTMGFAFDRGIAPSATFRYFGIHLEWDFDPRAAPAGSVIRSAELHFIDPRTFAPPGSPLPHIASMLVPELSLTSLMILVVGALGLGVSAPSQKPDPAAGSSSG